MPCHKVKLRVWITLFVVVYAAAIFIHPPIIFWTWGLGVGLLGVYVVVLALWAIHWVTSELIASIADTIALLRGRPRRD